MTAQPQWSPTDDDTADLLTLVATGSVVTESDVEWDHFVRALEHVAIGPGGRIGPNELRPLLRDRVAPRRIGAFTNRALSLGLVAYTGEWEISDDIEGRNGGKPCRVMRWIGGAA